MKAIYGNVQRLISRLEDFGGWDDYARDLLITAADDQLQLLQQMRDPQGTFKVLWYGTLLEVWRKHPVGGEPWPA